jgi:hypothetical protein
VPPALLGRVSSLDFFVSLALMPVSMALAGPVGEGLGIPITFVIAGLVPVVIAVLALAIFRMPKDELEHPLDPEIVQRRAGCAVHPLARSRRSLGCRNGEHRTSLRATRA